MNDHAKEFSKPGSGRSSAASTLVSRNVVVDGKRTSLRLEPAMWDALAEIVLREEMTIDGICTRIESRRHSSGLTAAVRVFILSYFRAAATEDGHAGAGHGPMLSRRRAS
jgi:predicted DNA-binding ribbon-helix-helix protein